MADINNTGGDFDAASAMYAPQFSRHYAGEDLTACTPVYLSAADDKFYACDATAADEKAVFWGIVGKDTKSGWPVTVYGPGTRFYLTGATNLTQAGALYLSVTAGKFADATSTNATKVVARVYDTDALLAMVAPEGYLS